MHCKRKWRTVFLRSLFRLLPNFMALGTCLPMRRILARAGTIMIFGASKMGATALKSEAASA